MAACYSNLPNELSFEIWSHALEPKAVESFALTKKAYTCAAKPTLVHGTGQDP